VAARPPPPGQELLDDLGAPPALVRESLRNVARANRWFGGRAAARFGLRRLLAGRRPARLSLLDVGTGQGDLPAHLAATLARRGTAVTAVGVERHPVAARAARDGGLPTLLACGLALPLRDRSVDVVLISQVAHHLAPDQVGRLAAEASRVARLGVVLADLRPSRLAAWGFRVGARVLGFDRATREDGVLSLARGFRPPVLRALLAGAGAVATVTRRPGARIVAWWSTAP
jgi:SAM-dependent methyltransferase